MEEEPYLATFSSLQYNRIALFPFSSRSLSLTSSLSLYRFPASPETLHWFDRLTALHDDRGFTVTYIMAFNEISAVFPRPYAKGADGSPGFQAPYLIPETQR